MGFVLTDVFISYKREERKAVERLAQELRRLGLEVWFDASLNAGQAFSDEIDREARAAKAILVCWSPTARESQWVKSEALIGFEERKLAACYVAGPDGFKPPTPFNSIHAEDLRAWVTAPSSTHAGFKSILRRIGALCGRPDIESYGALDVQAPAAVLRAWIERHQSSPLFIAVDELLRHREAEEAERTRLEQIARWKRAIENLDRNSSTAVAAFLNKHPDHPEASALRDGLPALEKLERERKAQAAYERMNRQDARSVSEFILNWPDHEETSRLRRDLPRIEREEETARRDQERREHEERARRERQTQIAREADAARARWTLLAAGGSVAAMLIIGVLLNFSQHQRTPVESLPTSNQTRVEDRTPMQTQPVAGSRPSAGVLGPAQNAGDLAAGARFRECDECPEMVIVPAGIFEMGSSDSGYSSWDVRSPVHSVSVIAFAIGSYEVTRTQWTACLNDGGCTSNTRVAEGERPGDHPANFVSWNDAQEYLQWISQRTGHSYRLPTEAEWEYVCRAGSTTAFPFDGDADQLRDYAWFRQNAEHWVHGVGTKRPNAFGLYDVLGNVSEWVEDCHHPDYNGAPVDGSAWTSGHCTTANAGEQTPMRVTRGGNWISLAPNLNCAAREAVFPTSRDANFIGFRAARTL